MEPKSINTTETVAPLQPPIEERIAPKEAALLRQTKLTQVLVTSCLATLALGILAAGIVLTCLLATPIFVILMAIASLLFAIVACIAYKNLALKANKNWKQELERDFKLLPDSEAIQRQFMTKEDVCFWQSKYCSQFYIALPRDLNRGNQYPYSFALPVARKRSEDHKASGKSIIVCAVDPTTGQVDPEGPFRNVCSDIAHGLADGWISRAPNYAIPRIQHSIFVDLARVFYFSLPADNQGGPYPDMQFNLRAPMLSDFQGSKRAIHAKYYHACKLTCLELFRRIPQSTDTLILPLFPSLYETPESCAASHCSLETANDLCLTAYVDALNDYAMSSDKRQKNLLIVVHKDGSKLSVNENNESDDN